MKFFALDILLVFFSLHISSGTSDGTALLSVFVYDDYLKEYVRHNLKRSDCVWVKGPIKYKTVQDDQGKKRYTGYIRAESVCKIVPLIEHRTNNKQK